jgi:TfoX/Sxy family transcriptional regulator of competence genes
MNHDPKALQAILTAAAPPDLPLTFKPMFGGILAYVDGKVFASLSNVGLALKLAGDDHRDFLALPGAEPLRYEPDAPLSKSYVVAPQALIADRDAFRVWIVRAAAGLAKIKAPVKRSKRAMKPG